MKKKAFIATLIFSGFIIFGCKKNNFPGPPAKVYSSDVATAWMKLHIKLTTSTTGFNSVVSDRSFGYAGLTLYESIVPGITNCNSLLPQFGVDAIVPAKEKTLYYWPASANAAMALITKDLFANTSAANMFSIDSLESSFTTQFQSEATTEQLQNSADFGQSVAAKIFDWSKTDGADQPYLHITDSSYVPPVGPYGYLRRRFMVLQYFLIGAATGLSFQTLQQLPSPVRHCLIQKMPSRRFIKW